MQWDTAKKVTAVQKNLDAHEDETTAAHGGIVPATHLEGHAPGNAEENVQPDWNQVDTEADDFVKNKPTLGTAAAKDVGTGAEQVAAGNHGHAELHSHANKASLDKVGEDVEGKPTWNDGEWPGASGGTATIPHSLRVIERKFLFGAL